MSTEQSQNIYVDFDTVIQLIGSDNKDLKEFCNAAITSFTSFKNEYTEYLLNRDLENLRKAGHRIKPVAQMLGLQIIIDEYEKSKPILKDEECNEKLNKSVRKMEYCCDKIIEVFKNKKQRL